MLADGVPVEPALADTLTRAGVTVRTEPVTGFRRSSAGATVSFADGPAEEVAGLFVTTAFAQSAPFAERLGLELLPSGCVRVDEFQRTSLPGVYAAGDLATSRHCHADVGRAHLGGRRAGRRQRGGAGPGAGGVGGGGCADSPVNR